MSKVFVLLMLCAFTATAADKPNVVIFFTDDQGTLDINALGAKDLKTPHMDQLVATGVTFTQAYAHTVCCPARAMLMTGRYPQRGGVHHWTQGNMLDNRPRPNMALSEITLAEVLKDAGYHTGLFGKWHLGAHRDHGPTKQGFDEFIGLRGGFIDNYNHHFLHGRGFYDFYEGIMPVKAPGKYFPDLITARALQFIDKHKDGPFFAYLAFNIPHYPEQYDPKYKDAYANLEEPRRSYAKMISTTDDHVGRILAKLEEYKLREKTIIVFMSDNGHSAEDIKIRVDDHITGMKKGTNYGANGGGGFTGKWLGNKSTMLEGGLRVPAMISWPGKLPEGEIRDQAMTAMDWMPTLLELAGIEKPKVKFDGASLVPVLKDNSTPSHYEQIHWQWGNKWAVREGDFKLLGIGEKALSLHRLTGDKPEQQDYLTEQPELAGRLLKLHQDWHKEVTPK